jgi:hypothetical protein
MTTIESLRKRIELARKATPGSWTNNKTWNRIESPVHPQQSWTGSYQLLGQWPPDLEHIAANDPQTVIETCEELIAAMKRIAKLEDIVHDNFHDEENCDCTDIPMRMR